MALNSIGDLSRGIMLRNANFTTKSALKTHSYEMATGIKSDIAAALKGYTGNLGHIEARLTALDAYKQAGQEMAGMTSAMQLALGNLQDKAQKLGANLVLAASHPSVETISSATEQAKNHLNDAILKVNTQIGGRHLFSGTENNKAPLAPVADFMTAIRDLIATTSTAQEAVDAISNFFDAPAGSGGFADQIYKGRQDPVSAAISPSHNVEIHTNATAPAIREVLKGLTLMTFAREVPFTGDIQAQAVLAGAAGQVLINAESAMAMLRGDLGTSEAAIEIAQSRNAAEAATLQLSRNDMIAVDKYEAISALAEAEARMEAIYSLTARLSRLSLAAYL